MWQPIRLFPVGYMTAWSLPQYSDVVIHMEDDFFLVWAERVGAHA